jgi:hypothetical protein
MVKFKSEGIVTKIKAWHVPTLGKNLIFLCTLQKQGCKFFSEGDDHVFVKRGKKVIMKARVLRGIARMSSSVIYGTTFFREPHADSLNKPLFTEKFSLCVDKLDFDKP